MAGDRWSRVDELYHAALDHASGERTAFLLEACPDDADLRREVESLLAHETGADDLLESPAWKHLSHAGQNPFNSPALDPGTQLGAYKIVEFLGAGGMSEVYKALDVRLTREVALKILPPDMESNAEWRQRFTREAQAASRLNHPNIVAIYDIGEARGLHFIAMEYVAGRTLAQAIPAGGLAPGLAAHYAAQIASALAKAHAAGVVHRDIKPANIMITDEGAIKVLDFGLAKIHAAERQPDSAITAESTHAGLILGTASYMSPEQAAGLPADARSDIFSWGLVLYEMLSGRRAFREETRFSTMAAILHKEPPPLSAEVPRALADIVARSLGKDPAARFQSIAEAAAALDSVPRETVANYRLLTKLRDEASGIVYKAEDTRLERLVALKLLSNPASGPQRVLREVRTVSALDHSNIGTVYDAGETQDGRVFVATAFYDGGSLQDRISAGVTAAEAVEFARQAAAGLASAHERGIVHGGVHPGCLMLTSEGVVKIVDFGLGMPESATAYRAPEQVRGEPADARSDIWSLGAVLRAMLANAAPSPRVSAILARALADDPASRYSSARDLAADLAAAQSSAVRTARFSRTVRWAAAAALIVVVALAAWWFLHERRVRWAREVAIPEIARLADRETNGAALRLASKARQYIPNDRALLELWDRVSALVNIETDPPGATVEVKDYLSPSDSWTNLGQTPLRRVRFPWGYSRVRISLPGRETYEFAHQVQGEVKPDLRLKMDPAGSWPPGMVKVPVRRLLSDVAAAHTLPVTTEFFIDRYEVTNRDYQKFVDAGGYREPRFWKQEFAKDGRKLSWQDAMRSFVDATGQPGPASWEAGRYPAGKDDLPVTGVSWYEAMAYAEFAGKQLPTISHWYAAAYPSQSPAVIRLSNFDSVGLAPAGRYPGVTAGGAYDMGGNAREWCWNAVSAKRYILGGTWRDPAYQFANPDAQDPFDRSSGNGFRCVKYPAPPDAQFLAPVERTYRDYSKEKPVSEDVFRGLQAFYAYEHTAPEGRVESANDGSPDWIKQRVTYDAGHDHERMPAWLFLPKNARPPFQVVVYFPGSGAFLYPDSNNDLVAFYQLDYLIRSGRAVLYPIYASTYERRDRRPLTALELRDREINWSKEVERSFDYLETRPEIDRGKMAFLGFSLGVRPAVRLAAYPPRVKTCIILSGGLYARRYDAETDILNFAPRLRIPTLMVNGRYDFSFPLEEYQKPLFRILGAPETDKKHALLEYAHNVGALPNEMRREVLAWLERYLGAVH